MSRCFLHASVSRFLYLHRLFLLVIIFGIVSGVLFVVTGLQLDQTGRDLIELRSVSGTFLAEAYYQEIDHYQIAGSFFVMQ